MSENLLSTKNNTTHTDGDDIIDVKKIVNKVVHQWPLYLASILLCTALAVVYAYFSNPTWRITSKILVKDEKGTSPRALSGSISSEFSSIFNAGSTADNEIQVLKSRTIMQKSVQAMQLNVRTYVKTGLKWKEIFKQIPFVLNLDYKVDTIAKREYLIEFINDESYKISNNSEDISITANFKNPVQLGQYNLSLTYIAGIKYSKNYKIVIEDIDATIANFSQNFTVSLADKQASAIDLSLNYQQPEKGEAILNKIMQLYLSTNLQNEMQIADSTMAFINTRINLVSKELNDIEQHFEQYKTRNNLANINEQSKALVTSASGYYDKLTQQDIQLSIIQDLERYLNNSQNKKVIPSSLINPADQSFGQAINSYNELLLTRDKASLSYTEDNPIIQNIDKQINNARVNLIQNLETYKKSLQVGKSQLEKQNVEFADELRKMPNKERNYLDFARQQNLKQELYLFLLQKREETAISRNSTISNSRILDPAKSDFLPEKPKKSVLYIIGFVLGIVLPSAYIFVKELFNVRITSRSDIDAVTKIPILGEIGHNSDKQSLVAGTNSRSVISEQFRSLRTNLQFVLDSSKSNVLLFTSSMSGEGKSFLSLNIGSALALTGKKVVFLEMDLRKPKLSASVGLANDNGFTNYAISDDPNYDIKKLLKPLSFNPNCYLVSSGPIPPNPAELLLSDRLTQLIDYLKAEFDYIIIDCAPVGLVTDALMFEKFANLTFYVARQGFTYKAQLEIANDLINTNKIKNLYLIINDIKAHKAGYTTYKQAYGYSVEEDNSRWNRWKFWK
ncbi:polysaccharide biosynthesis tyrosine autokinase [uncultured Mucilaginibacter sp.]|uniref:GumC family protein n=1 Tax=uncultured Mucilaginibacter sp. TaxID=797541 RepID=UPI0025CE20F4|nr:polysaccharide biosynthesis tyrosine autokinase [uncultured Mucilaginibacter sp.]